MRGNIIIFRNRRSQISFFIIVGIVILFLIGLFLYYKAVVTDTELEKSGQRVDYLRSIRQSIEMQTEGCINSLMEEYMFEHGIDFSKMEKYVKDNYEGCMDYSALVNDDDIKIIKGDFKGDFKISEDEKKIVAYIDYPISLDAPYGKVDFNEFFAEFYVEEVIDLRNIKNENIVYKKGFFVFKIERGTTVSGADEIELKIKNYPKDVEDITLGPLYIDIEPKGVTFNPPALLKVYYKEKDLGGFPEEELHVGWHDDIWDQWYVYETETYPADDYVIGIIDKTR